MKPRLPAPPVEGLMLASGSIASAQSLTMDTAAKAPLWQEHEYRVRELYQMLGYAVVHNINASGQQVNLICEKWIPGIGLTRLYVDCKHTSNSGTASVSKDDVSEFVYNFTTRSRAALRTAGVLVSNKPFSQYAKTAATIHPNIHLKTIDELQEDALKLRSYLYERVSQYESDAHFNDFIPLQATSTDTPLETGPKQPLVDLVRHWLEDSDSNSLCLLGDFGTGKTTFLEYLQYTGAKRYIQAGTSDYAPLLISLRKYYTAANASDLIKTFFSRSCRTSIELHYSSASFLKVAYFFCSTVLTRWVPEQIRLSVS